MLFRQTKPRSQIASFPRAGKPFPNNRSTEICPNISGAMTGPENDNLYFFKKTVSGKILGYCLGRELLPSKRLPEI